MKLARAIALCSFVVAALLQGPLPASATTFATGDVFAGVGNGIIDHFSPTGDLIEQLDTTTGSQFDTGMCFDGNADLRATNFSDNSVSRFNKDGALQEATWVSSLDSSPESCVVDALGNIYVGQADGTRDVLKFRPDGTQLDSFDVGTGARGSDWIDLAADQKTLFYTSENRTIYRYDLATKTQLSPFATSLAGAADQCFALRILSDGGVLVACTSEVLRLDASGTVVQTYPASSLAPSATLPFLFTLSLDPDGTSFWTADFNTGDIYRINISTGLQITQFRATVAEGSALAGLAIFKEPTVAGTQTKDDAVAFYDGTQTTIETLRDTTGGFWSRIIFPAGMTPGRVFIHEVPASTNPTYCGGLMCDAQIQFSGVPLGTASPTNPIQVFWFYTKAWKQGSTVYVQGDAEPLATVVRNCVTPGIANPPKCVSSRTILPNGDRQVLLLWTNGGDPGGGKR